MGDNNQIVQVISALLKTNPVIDQMINCLDDCALRNGRPTFSENLVPMLSLMSELASDITKEE